jgi:antitoxin component of MazEF toxin-antitoxin module
MKFRARVIPSGNATAVEIPADVMKALGSGPRPPVAVTVNGHTWRSRSR